MTSAMQHPIGPDSVEDWLAADAPADGGRLELMWGYFHATPPPSGPHQWAVGTVCRALGDAVRVAGRSDLYPVSGVGVEVSTALRTALIPDVSVLNCRPIGSSFPAAALELAVEVWSADNGRDEQETKRAVYAAAGVPFLWEVDDGALRAFRLEHGRYVAEPLADAPRALVTAAPVPVELDLEELTP